MKVIVIESEFDQNNNTLYLEIILLFVELWMDFWIFGLKTKTITSVFCTLLTSLMIITYMSCKCLHDHERL